MTTRSEPMAGHELEVALPLEERLRVRLASLRDNRERFIADAQRQLAALDGAIGELAALLEPDAQPSPVAHNGSNDGA